MIHRIRNRQTLLFRHYYDMFHDVDTICLLLNSSHFKRTTTRHHETKETTNRELIDERA